MQQAARRSRYHKLICAALLGGMTLLVSPADAQVRLTPFRSEILVNFLNDRAPQTRSLSFEVSERPTTTPTAIVLGDFVSTETPFVIPARDVAPRVSLADDDQTMLLQVVVRPSISSWKAGEYSSSIRIGGDGFESTTIPVTLTFRSGSPTWGITAAFGVLLFGLVVGYLLRANESSRAEPTQEQLKGLTKARKTAVTKGPALAGIVTGLVILIFGIDTQYLNNDTFGSGGFSDWLGLFAWGFAAGFSGKTVSDFTASKTTVEVREPGK